MAIAALNKRERYLLAAAGEAVDHPPVWIMRQAGRYMPQYMAMREKYTFMEMCYRPEVAAAASLLPLELLDVDILIIFNDILIPLEAMGLPVDFSTGGPVIARPVRSEEDLDRFLPARFSHPPVARSIQLLKKQAGPDVPVLGFCGAPFTLAAYAVEGRMSKSQHQIKEMMFRAPDLLHELLRRITETAADYLVAQIADGGADGVQIFESHSNILSLPDYAEFAESYQADLIARVRHACPGVPIHLYARGCGPLIESMAATGASVLGIDWTVTLADARRRTPLPLQGNLDPCVTLVPEAVERELEKSLHGFDWRQGWIANLGHGIIPQARVEAARRFVECVHSLGRRS